MQNILKGFVILCKNFFFQNIFLSKYMYIYMLNGFLVFERHAQLIRFHYRVSSVLIFVAV